MSRVRDLADNNVVFVDGITTADITEHTNLFFTNARADARLALKMVDEDNMSSNSAAHMPTQQSVKAYVDTEVASLVDSSPSTLDTLNELAAALGDDANFSTTVTNSIATKMPLAGGTFTGDVTFDGDAGNIVFDKSHDSLSFFQAAALKFVSTSATNQQSRIQWDGTRTHWETFNNTRVDLDGDFRLVGQSYNVEWDKSANALEFAENAKAIFGAGSDLQIYHDGSNSYIADVGTGDLTLKANGTKILMETAGGETLAEFINNGNVVLYSNDVERLRTNGTGIDVTGTVTADGLSVYGGSILVDNGSSAGTIYFHDTTNYINLSGDELQFANNGAERMRIDSSGNVGIGETNPDQKLVVGDTLTYHTLKVQGSAANLAATVKLKHHGGGGRTGIDPEWNISRGSDQTSFNSGVTAGNALVGGLAFWNNTIGGSNVDAMRLKDNGQAIFGYNVGIGITSPSAPLDVVTNSNVYAAEFTQSNTANGDGVSIVIGSTASVDYALTVRSDAGNTSVLAAKADGKVGIGVFSPSAKLHIQEGSSGGSLTEAFRISDSSYTNIAMYSGGADGEIKIGAAGQLRGSYKAQYAGTGSSYKFNIGTNATNAITIDTSQKVGIGTASPTEKLHVFGVIRSKGYDTDSITSYNITGSYSAGTEYVFTTRTQINGLGYGSGFYKFAVWSDTFHAGTSHYQCYTPYDEFYFHNYGSNTNTVQTINYGVSMGHAPNTATRAIDIRLRHKYGADATYPANQTFTFIPVNGFTNLNGNTGYHLRIYLFKVA